MGSQIVDQIYSPILRAGTENADSDALSMNAIISTLTFNKAEYLCIYKDNYV